MMVEGVTGVAYDELGEIETAWRAPPLQGAGDIDTSACLTI